MSWHSFFSCQGNFLFAIIILCYSSYAARTIIPFTEEEKEWIEKQTNLTVSNEIDWPPYNFIENDKPAGFSIDYMNLIAKYSGLKIQYVKGEWSEHLNNIKNKKLDVIMNITYTKERAKKIDFTKPYIEKNNAIFILEERNDIKSVLDFKGKSLATVEDFYIAEVIKSRYPQIIVKEYSSIAEAIKAVALKDADGFIEEHAVAKYIMAKEFITGMKEVAFEDVIKKGLESGLCIGIQKGNNILVNIINKTMENLPPQEVARLRSSWMIIEKDATLSLTKEEDDWLSKHKDIRLGIDPNWAPFEYFDAGNAYKGIASDYVKILNERLKINMHVAPITSWQETLQKAKNKELDVVPCATKNSERSRYLLFSEPYIRYPMVILARSKDLYMLNIASISGTIGIVKGYFHEEFIKIDYPNKIVKYYKNIDEAIIALKKGDIDAYIGNLVAISYTIRKLNIKDLHVSGHTEYEAKLCFAVRDDWPELVEIIDKELSRISPEEKVQIHSPWLNATIEHHLDWSIAWKYVVAPIIIALIIILIILYWNRKLTEEVKKRKAAEEKAYNASKAKSVFLANMSHEIRTPMNAIIGFADILSDLITDKNYQYYIDAIKTSAVSLLSLINDILDLSKVEAGKLELYNVPISLKKIFNEMTIIFKDKFQEKGIKFNVEIDDLVPKALFLDQVRLKQIILNLVSNAGKFTEKGYIELNALWKSQSNSNMGDLIITVKDTGVGIKEDQLENIFGAFSQAKGQRIDKYGGTGLGLAICQQLAHLMNGNISVSSNFGKGSTFLLKIQKVIIANENDIVIDEHAKIEYGSVTFKGSRILIVDDMPINRKLISLFLQGEDLELYEAEDGEEALKMVNSNRPDLILMDMQMPNMNGFECSDILKNNSQTKSIPIIAITASVMKEDQEKVIEYCDDILAKPINRNLLYSKLVKYLPNIKNN